MTIRWELHAATALPSLASRWDALNARSGNLPCLQSRFLAPLLSAFGDGHEHIALAVMGDETVAGLILKRRNSLQWQSFQPSQLPIGPCLFAPGSDIAALGSALARQLSSLTLQVGLTQLDPLLAPRPAQTSLDYIDTAWVDVVGDFDSYWEARGKNLRTNMRKQRKKLADEGVVIEFHSERDPARVPELIEIYGQLEQSGWKDGMGTAVDITNAQGRFYRDMLQAFCADGHGSIWCLSFDGKIVAMDLCIEAGSTLIVLKTAFDSAQRSYSPAFLLHQDAFAQIFAEQKIRRIEFYGRVMEWHTRWTDNVRTLYHYNAYRWACIPRLKQALRALRHKKAPAPTAESSDSES